MHPHGPLETGEREFRVEDVPRDRNFVEVNYGGTHCRIPLSDILDVWKKNDEVWAVKVSGTLRARLRSPPRRRAGRGWAVCCVAARLNTSSIRRFAAPCIRPAAPRRARSGLLRRALSLENRRGDTCVTYYPRF